MNAEDFYAAMLAAARQYFSAVRSDAAIEKKLLAVVAKEGGVTWIGTAQ